MKLDFSALESEQKNSAKRRISDFNEAGDIETHEKDKTPENDKIIAIRGDERAEQLSVSYQQEKRAQELMVQVYREYQRNIRLSEKLRTEILKDSEAGKPLINLLLKAAKCISLMTADSVFFYQLESNLREEIKDA